MTPELNRILSLLAASNPENEFKLGSPWHWVDVISDTRWDQEDRYKCLICGAHLGPNFEAHGMWHLKQKKLLPFL